MKTILCILGLVVLFLLTGTMDFNDKMLAQAERQAPFRGMRNTY